MLQTLSHSQNKLHLFHSLILSRSRCCSRCSSLSSISLPNFLAGQQCLPLSGVKGSCLCEQAKTAGRNCERTRGKLCLVYIAICVRLSFRGLCSSLLACSEKRDFYMNFYLLLGWETGLLLFVVLIHIHINTLLMVYEVSRYYDLDVVCKVCLFSKFFVLVVQH